MKKIQPRIPKALADRAKLWSDRFPHRHFLAASLPVTMKQHPARELGHSWRTIEDLAEYGRVTHAEIRDAARTISRWKAFMRRVAGRSNMPEELADSLFALTDRFIRIEVCPYENRVYCVMGRTMRAMA